MCSLGRASTSKGDASVSGDVPDMAEREAQLVCSMPFSEELIAPSVEEGGDSDPELEQVRLEW